MNKLMRVKMAGISSVVAIVVIGILMLILPETLKEIALGTTKFEFFTIQNATILAFFIGLGELVLRWRASLAEFAYLKKSYLPEDDRIVLQSHDLAPILQKVVKDILDEGAFLPNMIKRCVLQFQASKSVDETNSLLSSLADLYFHQIDLKYTLLRYVAWVIPTLGFIGTVKGIAGALKYITGIIGNTENTTAVQDALGNITRELGIAFNTTIVALVLSAILVFLIYTVQEIEEKGINKAVEYCLSNLINKLYTAA